MDFTNSNHWILFEWGGESIYVTDTLLSTWVVMGVLILFALVVRVRLSRFKDVPSGLQNVVEAAVDTMSNLVKSMMGKGMENFEGYFFSIFAFIIVSNYSGLFGLRPPTADIATTGALALLTFVLIHITGIRKQKGKYFKEYLAPFPVFLPLNIVGELAKPISLGFRLFGNILGGVIILGLVYEMLPTALSFVLPDVLHAYFDLFAGALQAFIFTVLSMTFIAQKAAQD